MFIKMNTLLTTIFKNQIKSMIVPNLVSEDTL